MYTDSIDVVVKEGYTLRVLIKDNYGTYHAIIYRQRTKDYVFCYHYDIADGTWGQGHYCSTYFIAMGELLKAVGKSSPCRMWAGINVKVH